MLRDFPGFNYLKRFIVPNFKYERSLHGQFQTKIFFDVICLGDFADENVRSIDFEVEWMFEGSAGS